jgi:predicted DNA-binding protein (MmcQ/YjbR family)
MAKSNALNKAASELRTLALGYPGAREEFPWGERVVKVNKKVFVFLGVDGGDELGLSVKLPASQEMALLLPFAEPTGYGLGKAGWVTARFSGKDRPPMAVLRAWLDESYRAVAPKKLVEALPPPGGKMATAAKRPAPAKKPVARKRAPTK